MLLSIPDFNMVHYGRRAFSHAALRLWNNIPVEIRKTATKAEFKNKLKTDLFKSYYNCQTVSVWLQTVCFFCTAPLGTLWILALYKFIYYFIIDYSDSGYVCLTKLSMKKKYTKSEGTVTKRKLKYSGMWVG